MDNPDFYLAVEVEHNCGAELALSTLETLLHHVEQKTNKLIEFKGRYVGSIYLYPSHVVRIAVWDPIAVKIYKEYHSTLNITGE